MWVANHIPYVTSTDELHEQVAGHVFPLHRT